MYSALIRSVLEAHLEGDIQAEIGRRIADGYRRIPPATPDTWGDLEEQTRAAARDVHQRLDAEERAAGFGPWKGAPGGRAR